MGGAAAGPAPASPHWRAGATRTREQYGGRAPHDSPVTTAHSGRAEGGFRSARAPGGAVHGPPLTLPHPGAALRPRPQATAQKGTGRPRRDTPPPPAPPPARKPRGPRPPPPEAGGMVPPPPERGAGARPAPPPQPPAPMGAAKNKRARAYAPGRRTDRTQRSLVSTHRSGMGGHAPHGQHNASGTRFVACPGKAEGRNEAERPPALQAPPRPHNRGVRRTPPPPPPPPARPPAQERHGPAPRRAAPTGRAGRGDRAGPPHPHARTHNMWIADPDSPPGGRAVGGGGRMTPDAPRNGRRHPPPGTPCRHPHNPKPSRGEPGPDRPPQSRPDGARDRGRTRGGAQTTWNGPTSARCRNHARCARHTTQGGGSGRRESASAHTRKGHAGTTRRATGPSARNAQTAWNGVPASEGKGHPDGTARHTQRGTRGAGRGKRERHNTRYRPEPPRTGRERRAHTDGALHPPRQ